MSGPVAAAITKPAWKLAVASLWLPLATEVVYAVESGGALSLSELRDNIDIAAFTWLGALPLTLAVHLLWKHSRLVACVYAVVLGLLTIALLGGVFWQPLEIGIVFSVNTVRVLPHPSMMRDITNIAMSLNYLIFTMADGPSIWLYALVFSVPAWTALAIVAPFPGKWGGSVTWTLALRALCLVGVPLWLPLAHLAITVVYSDSLSIPFVIWSAIQAFAPIYVSAWIAAHPLSLAVGLLHARSRVLAYICAVTLGALTAGLTPAFSPPGPLGIMLVAVIIALPAWAILGIVSLVQRNRACLSAAASV